LDAGMRLSAAVAAKEKQMAELEMKRQREFAESFTPLKPRVERDPAGTVFKYSPDIRHAYMVGRTILADDYAPAAQRAVAFTSAIDKSLEEQRALGASDRDAKALPNEDARALVTGLKEAKGPVAVAKFHSLQMVSGPHWPRVFGELVDAGLSPKYQILGWLDPARDATQVNAVSQVLNVSRDVLKKDLGSDSDADVRSLFDEIEDDYANFRTTWEFGPFGASAKDQAAGVIEAAKDVGLLIYRNTGDKDEGRREAFALFNNHFAIVESSNVHAIIPRELGIDDSDVEDATAFMQTRERIEASAPISVKSGMEEVGSEEVRTFEAEFRREQTLRAASSSGVWATNATGDALVLLLPFDNGVAYSPVRNDRDEPYEIPFGKVRELAARHRATLPVGLGGMVQ
jgi:hypothetical protein